MMMHVWDLNLRHIQAIVGIADLGTMNAAARAGNLTQPAITQALARTEAMLGAMLFERCHVGMTTTKEGLVLVPRFRAALEHISSPFVTMSRLRAFLALADAGSYSGASLSTGISLPSLHRAVNDLSLALRRSLVERRGRAVFLTDAGLKLARSLRLGLVELSTGLAELAALQGRETRRISIGAMPLSRAQVLPVAIALFLSRRPNIRFSIIEGSRAELLGPLRDGALDLMVGALREPLTEPDLVQEALFRDSPVVVGRKGHPLEGRASTLLELAEYQWVIAAPGAPLRSAWEKMFLEAGLSLPPVPVETGSVMTIRQLLVGSEYLSLLSKEQIAVELEAGWLSVLCEAPRRFDRTIGIAMRGSWRPTSVQAEFIADLRVAGQFAQNAGG